MNGVLCLKLHENKKDFFEIIEIVSQNYNLSPSIIEKDYWVTRALYLLSQNEMRDYAIFKGGTSLTKCYKDLKRFSEDIDIGILKENLGTIAIKKRMKNIEIAMKDDSFEVVNKIADSKTCRETEFKYNSLYDNGLNELHKNIRFEIMSFLEPTPYEKRTVTSFIQDYLYENNFLDAIYENEMQRFELNVLSLDRTLLEKMVSLIRMSYERDFVELRGKTRHLYDIHMFYGFNRDFFSNKEKCLELIDNIKKFEQESRFGKEYPLDKKWWESNLLEAFNNKGIKNAYEEIFGKEFVYGELPKFNDVENTFKELFYILKKLNV